VSDNIIVDRLIKIGVLLLLSPLWWPVAKAMWMEIKVALAPEGGLFGTPPTPSEMERLLEEIGGEDPLGSEPFVDGRRGAAPPSGGGRGATGVSRGGGSRGGASRGGGGGARRVSRGGGGRSAGGGRRL
jgi:hypothetical protein